MRKRIVFLCGVSLAASLGIAGCARQDPGMPPSVVPHVLRAPSAGAVQAHWTAFSLGTFADPYGVAVNEDCTSNCTIYVADPGAKKIWKVAPDGSRTAFGDFSSVGDAFDPVGVTYTVHGKADVRSDFVYVADRGLHDQSRVWRIAPDGSTYRDPERPQFPKYNRSVAAFWHHVSGVRLHSVVYIAQATHEPHSSKGRVICVGSAASCQTPYTFTTFSDPYGVAVDANGVLYVADARDKTIYKVSAGALSTLAHFRDPYGIAASPDGSTIYVADAGAKKVYQYTTGTGVVHEVHAFADPYGVAVDGSGNLYVADPGSKQVWKLTRS